MKLNARKILQCLTLALRLVSELLMLQKTTKTPINAEEADSEIDLRHDGCACDNKISVNVRHRHVESHG